MTCPQCGYTPTKGRPKKLDDKQVYRLRLLGCSLSQIALLYGTSTAAVHYSLKRSK